MALDKGDGGHRCRKQGRRSPPLIKFYTGTGIAARFPSTLPRFASSDDLSETVAIHLYAQSSPLQEIVRATRREIVHVSICRG